MKSLEGVAVPNNVQWTIYYQECCLGGDSFGKFMRQQHAIDAAKELRERFPTWLRIRVVKYVYRRNLGEPIEFAGMHLNAGMWVETDEDIFESVNEERSYNKWVAAGKPREWIDEPRAEANTLRAEIKEAYRRRKRASA